MIQQNFIVTGTVTSEPKPPKVNPVQFNKKKYNFFFRYDDVEGLHLPTGQSQSSAGMFVQYAIPETWNSLGPVTKGSRIIAMGQQNSNGNQIGDVITSVYTQISSAYSAPEGVSLNDATGWGVVDSVKVKDSYCVYTIREKKQNSDKFRMYYVYRAKPAAIPEGSTVYWKGHILADMFPMPEDATPFQIGKAPMFYATTILPVKGPSNQASYG